ncbi:glycoside hydrolase family 65 protein [Streptomyces boninensis]|uniref:glycoside hydrolase family 65 protein n=1 Tax=Streptomyces boninensis TaxID=2039455 RepID=UPI003B21B5C5
MTNHGPVYDVEPWAVRVREMDLRAIPQLESVFALANGHVGLRGTLDEGEPRSVPGTYLNGFFEERPYSHAEVGYGFPASGQTLVNIPDGKIIRLIAGDSPLDLRYGEIHAHEQCLDFRTGLLSRRTDWTSPSGRSVRVTSERLVSFTRRSIAAVSYEVEPLDGDLDIAIQSDLLVAEPGHNGHEAHDPRGTAAIGSALEPLSAFGQGTEAALVHRTKRSGLRVAVGTDHLVTTPGRADTSMVVNDNLARLTVATRLPRGEKVRLVKYLAYGWSHRRSTAALRDQVEGALATARLAGWEGLAAEQAAALEEFWANADVEIDGDPELQQAVRFALFHTLQAAVRAQGRAIPSKGLTGPGYDGHTFWDAETFVLPVLTYTAPRAARDALGWRHSTLPLAREHAVTLGQKGAAFPWRTIRGEECSGYWPAGTAAFHINADIADAVARYTAATDDADFDAGPGLELLVETARLWTSLGHFDDEDGFRIHGVTGPDEYTAVVDDNAYTNLMAQRNLREAAAVCDRRPEAAAAFGVDPEEPKLWRTAADNVVVPYDEHLGVHNQSQGFTEHAEWDFAAMGPEHYPLLLTHPYFEIYRKQVIKQADLVLALHLRGDYFTAEEKLRNFAYYEARTVRDSSLSAATQGVVAAEVGYLDLAHAYWRETALTDLHDLHRNIHHGLHIASMAGAWSMAVAGCGGMRDHDGLLTFAPRLPPALSRLSFRMGYRGRCLQVEVVPEEARYRLLTGDPLEIAHHGEPLTITTDEEPTRPIPPLPRLERVVQPVGREPDGYGGYGAG